MHHLFHGSLLPCSKQCMYIKVLQLCIIRNIDFKHFHQLAHHKILFYMNLLKSLHIYIFILHWNYTMLTVTNRLRILFVCIHWWVFTQRCIHSSLWWLEAVCSINTLLHFKKQWGEDCSSKHFFHQIIFSCAIE